MINFKQFSEVHGYGGTMSSISEDIRDFLRSNENFKFISVAYSTTHDHGLAHYALLVYDDGEKE